MQTATGITGTLPTVVVALALLGLYLYNRKRPGARGESDRPLTARERRLHAQAMVGVIVAVVAIIAGAVPGLVAIVTFMTPNATPADKTFWGIVLAGILVVVLIGWAMTRDARKKLARGDR